MKISKERVQKVLKKLEIIEKTAAELLKKHKQKIEAVHKNNKQGMLNMIHYLALRDKDTRKLQEQLASLGLSRLGKAEAHVMASISKIKDILSYLTGEKIPLPIKPPHQIKEAKKIAGQNAEALFGPKVKKKTTRIMVTLPAITANDYQLVKKLVENGMRVGRINCAHDNPEVWLNIISNIRRAAEETKLPCKVALDLSGPKLRTGKLPDGPKVVHFSPERDSIGGVVIPADVIICSEIPLLNDGETFLPVTNDVLDNLKPGVDLLISDVRGHDIVVSVTGRHEYGFIGSSKDTAYILSGTDVFIAGDDSILGKVKDLPPAEQWIPIRCNDIISLVFGEDECTPAKFDDQGKCIAPSKLTCPEKALFEQVKRGQRVLFDDGSVVSEVEEVREDELILRVTFTKKDVVKIRSFKGINIPDTELKILGLTAKDKEDLKFIALYGDIVNLSFVNSANDLRNLFDELQTLNASHIGVVIKIETQSGFKNLPSILAEGMTHYPVGVMIARGDLAVEYGWEALAFVQTEIMRISESALLPVIWATQVLESLTKKGIPSRAEITDVAEGGRADCVMLNKGPHILSAVEMIDTVFAYLKKYSDKKSPLLPPKPYADIE